MRKVLYNYNTRGVYYTNESTCFGDESHLRFIMEPHDFCLAIGDEVRRKTSCDKHIITVSSEGEVIFCNAEGAELARAADCGKKYAEARLTWKQGEISINFGHTETVDHYPHCDGEYDRWSTEYCIEREVTLDLVDRTIRVC